jgi:hypothetical protein
VRATGQRNKAVRPVKVQASSLGHGARAEESGSPPSLAQPSLVEIAGYFRESMDRRRAIQLRAFLGLVSFDLLLSKGSMEAIQKVQHAGELRLLVRMIAIGGLVLLAGLLFQVEARNAKDRGAYRTAEEKLRRLLKGSPPESVPYATETRLTRVKISWAATWPFLASVFLTAVIWVFVGLLRA